MPIFENKLFETRVLKVDGKEYHYFPLDQLNSATHTSLGYLPYSIRILLENALHHVDSVNINSEAVLSLANWSATSSGHGEFFFMPARILLQDLTGVPLVVDLASLRSAASRNGMDPVRINPQIPVDLVVDHSIQVDFFGTHLSLFQNTEMEFKRNHERYQFLKWAQSSIQNFRVIPPSSGIVHQVHLEYLAQVAMTSQHDGLNWVFPDSVFGTDSHTTMVNGLGVLGWGVGGIEAAAAMLGNPVETLIPDVIGVNITGQLREGSSPTDIVLNLTQQMRLLGVVDKIVEFFGEGLDSLTVPDRAMLANMAPEYGATVAYFPVDAAVIDYLRLTGRPASHIMLVDAYYRTQGLFRTSDSQIPTYSRVVKLELDKIEPSMAGPKCPQDLVPLHQLEKNFQSALSTPTINLGFAISEDRTDVKVPISIHGEEFEMTHGSVVIASITSCTNTSNPFTMICAGLLAKKAVALGLHSKPFVKTSLAPGSRTVMDYLEKASLIEPLERLGFHLVGYGCTTCIGNSGPLHPAVSAAIEQNGLVAVSVLSGNRNFEGRIHPLTQGAYLASPALVVAFAISGSVRFDMLNTPLGSTKNGEPVYLKDIWPSNQEVQAVLNRVIQPEMYERSYAQISEGDEQWQSLNAVPSLLYPWDSESTYIKETPFSEPVYNQEMKNKQARMLAIFGDSFTTDSISPAGAIAMESPAADYLREKSVLPVDFNTYGSRRGNHEVMMRGTFANIRIKNLMLPGVEGGFTTHYPDNKIMRIFDAAAMYKQEGVDLIILAGKEYGTGSSRDWAAKGPLLLGVKAILAESFERIHRSNLVGMGILPIKFLSNANAQTLGLSGSEEISFSSLDQISPGCVIQVTALKSNGTETRFNARVLLNSETEVKLWKNGGILRSFST